MDKAAFAVIVTVAWLLACAMSFVSVTTWPSDHPRLDVWLFGGGAAMNALVMVYQFIALANR